MGQQSNPPTGNFAAASPAGRGVSALPPDSAAWVGPGASRAPHSPAARLTFACLSARDRGTDVEAVAA